MKDFDGKLYVLIRSVQPSRYSRELQEIRTRSVYVPIHSVQLLHKICEMGYGPTASEGLVQLHLDSHSCPNVAISFPFLYVPLYVPIRSCTLQSHKGLVQLRLVSHSCPNVAILFTFLYVPLYVPIRSCTLQTHKAICGGLPAHTPIITSMICGADTATYRHKLFYKLPQWSDIPLGIPLAWGAGTPLILQWLSPCMCL